MKGVPGLLIALALGITGGLCNWFYMSQKARDLDMVEFIGVPEGIKAGDIFKSENLTRIPVPQRFAVRLREAAPVYSEVSTLINTPAYRDFRPGEIVLRQDLLTPPGYDLKKDLGPKEEAVWVTVDSRGFVPAYFSGGDEVSFIVAKGGTIRNSVGDGPAAENSAASGGTDVIGPFRILALGTRRGSYERARAQGFSTSQENIVAVRVTRASPTAYEPKAQELLDRLRLSNNQALGMVLHSGKTE